MKKKLLLISLSILMILNTTACGNSETTKSDTDTHNHTHISESANDDLFTVELTLPPEHVGETTQQELNEIAQNSGYKSITLNEDGSATYIMTEGQHAKLLSQVSDNINNTLKGMIGSENYLNFASVTANSDFTAFTVNTIATEMGTEESNVILTLFMLSGIYHVFKGTPADNVHIDIVNYDSNETIYAVDSSDMTNN